MSDKRQVMYDIERCICHVPDACRDCSHYKHGEYLDCMEELLKDAIALLKEQEAVKSNTGHWIYKKYDDMFMCSCCEKYSIRNDYPYCHWCGAKMKVGEVE